MKIAVVIPTLNRKAYLREALVSVAAQSRPPDEVLVSDNFSDNPNGEIAAEFSGLPIRVVRQPQRLPMEDHWWWCLANVESEYVCLLEDDNLFRPDHLASLDEAAAAFPEATLLGTSAMTFEKNPCSSQQSNFAPVWPVDQISAKPALIPREEALAAFIAGGPSASSALMVRRETFLNGSFVKSGCRMSLDRWLWAQFALQGDTVFVPRMTMLHRMHASNATKSIDRKTHIRELNLVTELVLDGMERAGIDPDRAWSRHCAKLDHYARDLQGKTLLRTRNGTLIRRFLPPNYGKSSLTACAGDIARLLRKIALERLAA